MVVNLVGSLAGLLKYHGKTIIDSSVFRLHYRWTSSMLFLACILLTALDMIGDNFKCMGTNNKKVDDWTLNYCWITSTYTLDIVGIQEEMKDVNGLGTYDPKVHEQVYHAYYQWVPFVLFGMGCFFYVPHIIWKSVEGKTVEKLLQGLNRNSMLGQSTEKVNNIVRYLHDAKGINGHYFYFYLGVEVLNLVNVVTQMCLLDKFLGGQFWEYGITSVQSLLDDENKRRDPMIQTFPRITKCRFSFFGPSATIEERDQMCLLPQNILNEKIFLVIWIWFMILTTISATHVVMRLILLLTPVVNERFRGDFPGIPHFNIQLPHSKIKIPSNIKIPHFNKNDAQEQVELENFGASNATKDHEALVSRTLCLGDYCLLELLKKNLDYATFQAILKGM